jgi:hypothetical protein
VANATRGKVRLSQLVSRLTDQTDTVLKQVKCVTALITIMLSHFYKIPKFTGQIGSHAGGNLWNEWIGI